MSGRILLVAAAIAAMLGSAPAMAQADLLSGSSFESPTPGVQYNGVQYDSSPSAEYSYISQIDCCTSASPETLAGWTWTGNTGVIAGSVASSFNSGGTLSGYDGAQYAFLQNSQTFNFETYQETQIYSSVSQQFTVASDGDVSITWLISGRAGNGDMTYSVTAGSLTADDSVAGGSAFSSESLTGELAAGTYTLTITNTTDSSDASVYLDDVIVTAESVPEPASAAILAAGLLTIPLRKRR